MVSVMKVMVKSSVLVSGIRKVSAGLDKDGGIVASVENSGDSYLLSLRVDGELLAYTQFPITVEPEGAIEVVLPPLFATAVQSLAKLGDDMVLDFDDTRVLILCKSGRVSVPFKSNTAPQEIGQETPMSMLQFDTVKLKAAVNCVKPFIIPVKGANNWVNCLGLRFQEGSVRFIGANNAAYSYTDVEPTSVKDGDKLPALAIPVVPFVKSLNLCDSDICNIYVLGEEVSGNIRPKKVMIQDGNTMFIMSLITMAYGSVDGLSAKLVPTVKFRAIVDKSQLIEAIHIASITSKTNFFISKKGNSIRVSDSTGATYADVSGVVQGEMSEACFNPLMVLSGLSAIQAEKVCIATNAELMNPGSDRILFISPAKEGVSDISAFLPINSSSKEAAQAAEMKKKKEAEAQAKAEEETE